MKDLRVEQSDGIPTLSTQSALPTLAPQWSTFSNLVWKLQVN